MKIKIDNKTDYDTVWLRKIFNRSKKMAERRLRKHHLPIERLRADVVYGQSLTNWTGGYAYYHSNYMKLKLMRPPEKMIIRNWYCPTLKEDRVKAMKGMAKSVAEVFIHELYHCYGYKHEDKEMFLPRKKIWIEYTYNYDWTEKYPVQFKTEKPKPVKPKIDIQVVRYQRVLELLKEKHNKLKRIQNQIKKYMDKKRYYEKVLVAKGKSLKE